MTLGSRGHADAVVDLSLQERLEYAGEQLLADQNESYESDLIGTLGADPMQPLEARPEADRGAVATA